MDIRTVVFYACAAAVVGAGLQVIGAIFPSASNAEPAVTPGRLVRVAVAAWRRVPWLTAAFLLVTVTLSVLQWPFPAVLHALDRDPNGGWWRLVYLGSGIAANAVSAAGWAPSGAGSSVFICGLVGALATRYLVTGSVLGAVLVALPRPVAVRS